MRDHRVTAKLFFARTPAPFGCVTSDAVPLMYQIKGSSYAMEIFIVISSLNILLVVYYTRTNVKQTGDQLPSSVERRNGKRAWVVDSR